MKYISTGRQSSIHEVPDSWFTSFSLHRDFRFSRIDFEPRFCVTKIRGLEWLPLPTFFWRILFFWGKDIEHVFEPENCMNIATIAEDGLKTEDEEW